MARKTRSTRSSKKPSTKKKVARSKKKSAKSKKKSAKKKATKRTASKKKRPSKKKTVKKASKKKPTRKKATKKKGPSKKKTAKKSNKKKSSKKKTATTAAKKSSRPNKKSSSKTTSQKKASKKKGRPKKKSSPAKKPFGSNPISAFDRAVTAVRIALKKKSIDAAEAKKLGQDLRRLSPKSDDFVSLFSLFKSDDPHGLRSQVLLALESMPEDEYFEALLLELPRLKERAPDWAFVSIVRILNSRGTKNDSSIAFENLLKKSSKSIRATVIETLEEGMKELPASQQREMKKALARLEG